MFVNKALVLCLLYFSKAEGDLYQDSLTADDRTIYMAEEIKSDDETETVNTELTLTEVKNRNDRKNLRMVWFMI